MRGLRRVAAYLLPALASSLVIPNDDSISLRDEARLRDPHILYRPLEAFIEFILPCEQCSDDEREVIEDAVFTFQVLPTDEPCPSEEVAQVLFNGHGLPGHPKRTITHVDGSNLITTNGFDSFALQSTKSLQTRRTPSHWHSACVCLEEQDGQACAEHNMATVLTFALPMKGNGNHPQPGFTITYKQLDKPEIIRFSTFYDVDVPAFFRSSKHWQSTLPSSLLESATPEQPAEVPTISSQQLASTPTASASLLPVWTSTFSYTDHLATSSVTQPFVAVPTDVSTSSQSLDEPHSEPERGPELSLTVQNNSPLSSFENYIGVLEHKAQGFIHSIAEKLKTCSHGVAAGPSSSKKKASSRKSYAVSKEMPTAIATHILDHDDLTTESHVLSTSNTSSPPKLRGDQALRAVKITSLIMVIVAISGVVFAYLVQNPRRRADRAALREERRNMRLYRRAALRQQFFNWYYKVRGLPAPRCPQPLPPPYSSSGPEKRPSPTPQNQASPSAIREEFNALRNAHRIVDGLIRAEEGGERTGNRKPRVRRFERRARRDSDSSSDMTGPPPYEECENDEVVDGFRYVSYALPRKHSTPDSSVISTSPRTSIHLGSDSEKD